MALERMRATMLEWLEASQATFQQQREYQRLWDSAMAHPDEPLPCPDCHLLGKISRLSPLDVTQGGVGRVVCNVCRAQFEFQENE